MVYTVWHHYLGGTDFDTNDVPGWMLNMRAPYKTRDLEKAADFFRKDKIQFVIGALCVCIYIYLYIYISIIII
jgi:hypothetical protein